MKKVIGLLATAAVLGLNIAPASAVDGNDGVVQTQTQESIITGNGNGTYQRSAQRSTNVRSGRAGFSGDSAVIQDSSQGSDVFGNRNFSEQVNEQESGNLRVRPRQPRF
ncbi:MAG: hypothetical protein AAFY11_01195 [Cyanobacteria bacterium J06641_5]